MPNGVTVWRDGKAHVPEHLSKEQDIPLAAGDRVHVRTPGGGGFGDPLDRDAQAVARDVAMGTYTAAASRDLFGVVLNVETGAVDDAGTAALRRLKRRQTGTEK